MKLNNKQYKTLEAVFAGQCNLRWNQIENLFLAVGAKIVRYSGVKIRVMLHGIDEHFHALHHQKDVGGCLVREVKKFLISAGIDL